MPGNIRVTPTNPILIAQMPAIAENRVRKPEPDEVFEEAE
jgi:hypothetical protein